MAPMIDMWEADREARTVRIPTTSREMMSNKLVDRSVCLSEMSKDLVEPSKASSSVCVTTRASPWEARTCASWPDRQGTVWTGLEIARSVELMLPAPAAVIGATVVTMAQPTLLTATNDDGSTAGTAQTGPTPVCRGADRPSAAVSAGRDRERQLQPSALRPETASYLYLPERQCITLAVRSTASSRPSS